jgi:hypothetical protein
MGGETDPAQFTSGVEQSFREFADEQ